MAEYGEVYRRAHYYDIAFARDVTREVDFVVDEFRRLAHRPLGSLLEIACGPGYHTRGFARRGIATFALDLYPEMIAFAEDKAKAEGLAGIRWIAADMRTFALERPVDAAIAMYDALDCLLEAEDVVAHFKNVAANLAADGIYVLEFTHPRDTGLTDYGSFHYAAERNGTKVQVNWAINRPEADPLTHVFEVETVLRVTEHGRETVIVDRAKERFFTAPELVALTKLSQAFDVAGCYGDFVSGQRIDNSPASRRMIFVLQKKRKAS
jgi:SAM-dependent methyltransferase